MTVFTYSSSSNESLHLDIYQLNKIPTLNPLPCASLVLSADNTLNAYAALMRRNTALIMTDRMK